MASLCFTQAVYDQLCFPGIPELQGQCAFTSKSVAKHFLRLSHLGVFYLESFLLTAAFPKLFTGTMWVTCILGTVRPKMGKDGIICAHMCLEKSMDSHSTHYKHVSFEKCCRKEPCLTLITKFSNYIQVRTLFSTAHLINSLRMLA